MSGRSEEEQSVFPLPGIEPRFLGLVESVTRYYSDCAVISVLL
jgi:hypothetical protein